MIRGWLNARRYKAVLKRMKFRYRVGPPELQRVFTTVDGQNIYIFKNPLDITGERWSATQEAIDAASFSVTRGDLSKMFDELSEKIRLTMESGNTGVLGSVYPKVADMAFRLSQSPIEKYTLELGACLFLIDGENPEILETWATEKKKRAAEIDPTLRSFFFENALQLLSTLTRSLQGDTESYSKAQKAKVNREKMRSSLNRSVARGLVSSVQLSQ